MHRTWLLLVLAVGATTIASARDWQAIGPWGGFDFALKAPDRSGQRVYANGNGGLFRTDDRGGLWVRLLASVDGRFVYGESLFAVSRADPDALLAVTGGWEGVVYSSDGGASWRTVFQLDPSSATRVTAVALGQVDVDRLVVFTAEYGANPTHPRQFSSQDGGLSWTSRSIGVPPTYGCTPETTRTHAVTAAVFDASVTGKLYASTVLQCRGGSQIVRYDLWSDQGGAQTPIAAESVEYPFAILNSDIGQSGAYLYWRRSSWFSRVAVDGSGSVALAPEARAMSVADGHVLAGTQFDLLLSTDGGATWAGLGDAAFFQGLAHAFAFSSVRFDNGDILASNRFGVLLKSEAAPWQSRSRGLGGTPVAAMRVSQDGSRIWASTRGSQLSYHGAYPGSIFQHTSDAGQSWHAATVEEMPFELNRILVDPDTGSATGGAVLYGSGRRCQNYCQPQIVEGFGIYKSTDDGATWSYMPGPDLTSYANAPAIAGDFLAGTAGHRTLLALAGNGMQGVFRSPDSGATWSSSSLGLPVPVPEPPETPRGLDLIASPLHSGTYYLGTTTLWQPSLQVPPTLPAGVFRTVDHGASWEHVSAGLPVVAPGASATGVFRLAAHPADSQRLWAVTYERDEFNDFVNNRVFRTDDGAETWFESGAGLPAGQWWAIAVEEQRPDYVYVSGSEGVFYSRNGGSGWQRLGSLALSMTTALSVNETGVYAGGRFGIHRIDRPDTPDGVFDSGFEVD